MALSMARDYPKARTAYPEDEIKDYWVWRLRIGLSNVTFSLPKSKTTKP